MIRSKENSFFDPSGTTARDPLSLSAVAQLAAPPRRAEGRLSVSPPYARRACSPTAGAARPGGLFVRCLGAFKPKTAVGGTRGLLVAAEEGLLPLVRIEDMTGVIQLRVREKAALEMTSMSSADDFEAAVASSGSSSTW